MRDFVCITGAAGGFGKAMAAECACRGWDLVLTDVQTSVNGTFIRKLNAPTTRSIRSN